VGLELVSQLHRLLATRGLSYDRDVGHPVQTAAHALSKERVVIGYQ
jgi:hypothetical protein